jgi:nitrogen-specific signal transduction histidine kinase/CheY-like chemotaxis protein
MATIPEKARGRERFARSMDTEVQRQKLETIGRLASGVAHDFANLVTLITGYSEIILNRMDAGDPQRADLEEIRKAASRGAHLTGQLLGFTRSEAIRPQPLDLNCVINDIERMLRHIIGENVELRTECAGDLAKVMADRGQIEQVLTNLILNARDAMPMGGRIVIRTANSELSADIAEHQGMRPGACVVLVVADTGQGIRPVELEHVFEPFFTTKEKGRGTGLGLSTVQSIVRQSGGAVWVASQFGDGATFTVCLPRMDAAPGVATAPKAVKLHSGTETILLVEDDAGVRNLLSRILRERGYTVLEAWASEEALRIFRTYGEGIQLVLTDIVMPGMSGLELTSRLRAVRPDLRIVCMSGYAEDVLMNSGSFQAGTPFLRKPLRPDDLAAGVREALDSPPLPFNPE